MLQAPSFLLQASVRSGRLKGIARLAAESEDAEERNDVDYNWLECRSALNRVNGSRVGFEWSINPYRGCEFGCVYCYARYTHEFMELREPMAFERQIFLKRGLADRLARELNQGRVADGETVVIGAATDPYQPAERRFGLTREVLEVLARHSGLKISIITKSDLIQRDMDLLARIARRHQLTVNITVTTTDAELARKTEPRAVTPRRRLEAVRRLKEAGVTTGVYLMPVLPGLNDTPASLESVAREAARSGAAFLAHSILFLNSCSKPRYEQFLNDEFPHLRARYNEYYGGGPDAPQAYRSYISRAMGKLRAKHGLASLGEASDAAPEPPNEFSQLDLFGSGGAKEAAMCPMPA